MQRNTLTKCVGSFTVYIFWQVLSLPVCTSRVGCNGQHVGSAWGIGSLKLFTG